MTRIIAAMHGEWPWFRHLFGAYTFLDATLCDELKRSARNPACRSGCGECCSQPIPLTAAEALGIRHYLAKLPAGDRPFLTPKESGTIKVTWTCLFLRDGLCTVYPVRPFACRRYLVFTKPCARGEDPIRTRPQDVHRPSERALLQALNMTLPVYRALGVPCGKREDRDFFNQRTGLMQSMDWPGKY